jgi:tetratricopeptide (TPR) repeat protein/protein involved in polysaccharide export with SLBB domain
MKKTFWFRFVLCILSVLALSANSGAIVLQDREQAAVYYRDGARFALEGRLTEAINAFNQAIALDPKNEHAYYSLGNVYSELGRWADAVAAYRQAVGLNKNDGEAYNGLGKALSNRGLYEQSAAAFERAAEIYPRWAEPRFNLSLVYRKLGRESAAREAYNQAIRRRPDYATHPPLTLMTAAGKSSAEIASKEGTASSGAAIGSGLPDGNSNARGATPQSVESRSGATPVRSESSNAAAQFNTRDAKAYYNLSLEHNEAGRYEEAVAALRRAIVLDKNNVDAYFALGSTYARLERWRESVDAYEQVIRLDPTDEEAYERLGRSYAKLRESLPPGGTVDGNTAAVGVKTATPSNASSDANGAPPEKNVANDSGARAANSTIAGRNAATSEGAGLASRPVPESAADDGSDPSAIYRVGSGDVLEVSMGNGQGPRMTSHTVTATGLLNFPPLNEPLKVSGLTTDEIAAQLRARLKRNAPAVNPEVAVAVREYASHAIIISGMVKDAGTKILRREGVPLYVIIAHAQPLPEAGQAHVISHVTRQNSVIDLSDTAAMKMLVRPGDVITVQARTKQYFYIAGAVKEPGQKEYHAGLTLGQALLVAGGVTLPSTTAVTIARRGNDGRLGVTRYDLKNIVEGKSVDPFIQPGDRIEVLR